MLLRRFTAIELAMVWLVLAVVAQAMSSRALRHLEVAEKAAMTVTVLEVERGMRMRLALAAMEANPASAEKLQDINPFEFARALPPNYLGELGGSADPRELKPGNWYYHRDRREIGYRPRFDSRLRTPDGKEIAVLRFRVEKGAGPHGLPHLVPVTAYQWAPEFGTF